MTDVAVGLRARGLDLSVLTAQPHYHSGDHERQPRRTTVEGVPVERLRVPLLRTSTTARYLFDWVVFALAAFVHLLLDDAGEDREILFVSNPPILTAVVWAVCKLRGWEYTYILYDPYPHTLVTAGYIGEDNPIARLWYALNRRVYRDARGVITIGTQLRDLVVEEAGPGFDAAKLDVVDLWEDEDVLVPLAKADNPFSRRHGLVDPFVVLYSGNIGVMHDLGTLVRAAAAFEDEDVLFLVIGEGTEKRSCVELAARLGLDEGTVRFLPYQPLDALPYSLTSGDVSVVSKRDDMPEVSCKVYTSLAVGEPVLVVAPDASDEARIVRTHDAGQQCPPRDVEAVVEAVERWRSDSDLVERQGENARRAFERHYSKPRGVDAYYRSVTGVDPPAPEE
nr:glycosyltransferase family 4 protein [Halomarina oriensis]